MQNKEELHYHRTQFETPYRSTVAFWDWLSKVAPLQKARTIFDVGTGMGSNLFYFQTLAPEKKYIGIDSDADLVQAGTELLNEKGSNNVQLEVADLYNLKKEKYPKIDGMVSLQVLSWLKNYEEALNSLLLLEPEWVAATSLFYDGEIDAYTQVKDYYRPSAGQDHALYHYNVYSLDRIKRFFAGHGYTNFQSIPYKIDIDLAKKTKDLGTYTIPTPSEGRLQFTGPLHLPWHFIFASRPGLGKEGEK